MELIWLNVILASLEFPTLKNSEQSCPLCGDMHQLEIVPLSLRHPIKKFAFNFYSDVICFHQKKKIPGRFIVSVDLVILSDIEILFHESEFLRGFLFLFFTVVANWFVSAACSPHPRIWHLTPHKSMLRNHRNFTTSTNLFCSKTGPKLKLNVQSKRGEQEGLCTSAKSSHRKYVFSYFFALHETCSTFVGPWWPHLGLSRSLEWERSLACSRERGGASWLRFSRRSWRTTCSTSTR